MPDLIDDQELAEREEAASALAGEDERHFVDYCIECARESRDSRRDILDAMSLLWDGYQNVMDFGEKEDWQSRVITPKPFSAVERAVSIIGGAFRNPNYITAEGVEVGDKDMSEHVKEALTYWCSPQKVDFPRKFTNACRMAMAVGLSLEVIPRWEDGMILDWTEPWKVLRDPDALPGEPWSGNYWIHQEWIDKWKIQESGKSGYYINTDQVKEGGPTSRLEENKEEIERRKKMWWDRSTYRKAVLVQEFNGVILDKRGDLLLPGSKFTIAGDTLIRRPTPIHYVKMRWPGSSFTPIPHVLRYDGRGLIEGVFELWKMLNKMLSLMMDDFSWSVNRMREIMPELLLDPTDLDFYPGKDIYRTTDLANEPVVRDLLPNTVIDKILAVAQYTGQQIDNGDFVSEFVSGLPGTRSNITKGEVEIKTEQNMGIFDAIGMDVEAGAVNIAYSMYETMILNWNAESTPSPSRVLGNNEFTQFLEGAGLQEKKQFLKEQCDIKIVGISAQLQREEKVKMLMALKQFAESPLFNPYFKPKILLDEIAGALGQYKAPYLKTDDEMSQEEMGKNIMMALGKLAQSGDPQTRALIQQLVSSVAPQQGGAGGNGGMGEAVPAEGLPEEQPPIEAGPAEVPSP